jgi:hypothetical protein
MQVDAELVEEADKPSLSRKSRQPADSIGWVPFGWVAQHFVSRSNHGLQNQ